MGGGEAFCIISSQICSVPVLSEYKLYKSFSGFCFLQFPLIFRWEGWLEGYFYCFTQALIKSLQVSLWLKLVSPEASLVSRKGCYLIVQNGSFPLLLQETQGVCCSSLRWETGRTHRNISHNIVGPSQVGFLMEILKSYLPCSFLFKYTWVE